MCKLFQATEKRWKASFNLWKHNFHKDSMWKWCYFTYVYWCEHSRSNSCQKTLPMYLNIVPKYPIIIHNHQEGFMFAVQGRFKSRTTVIIKKKNQWRKKMQRTQAKHQRTKAPWEAWGNTEGVCGLSQGWTRWVSDRSTGPPPRALPGGSVKARKVKNQSCVQMGWETSGRWRTSCRWRDRSIGEGFALGCDSLTAGHGTQLSLADADRAYMRRVTGVSQPWPEAADAQHVDSGLSPPLCSFLGQDTPSHRPLLL